MSKHKPATRQEFADYILRKLGAPVIQINVSEDQVEDAIEESLKYFHDYHYDGTEHIYYVRTLQQTDIDTRSIPIPQAIIGVTEVYSLTNSGYPLATNMFDGGYQMALDIAFNMTNGSILSFYLNQQQYGLLQNLLVGQTPIRYNRHLNVLHIDGGWKSLAVGDNIVVDAYQILDPETNTDIWNDRWLQRYARAKLKYMWASNLSKFDSMQLPGGVTFSAADMRSEANDEIQALEDEMLSSYSIPPRDCIA